MTKDLVLFGEDGGRGLDLQTGEGLVAEAVSDLLLAFQAGPAQTVENKVRLIGLHLNAVDRFHHGVALAAISWLHLNNPRNPFAPTPQDVYETCRRVQGTWASRVRAYHSGSKWGTGTTPASLPLPWGPKPLQPGCLIPDELVHEWARAGAGDGKGT